jgi:hypothetical protein
MKESVTQLTIQYIDEHPEIKRCLKKDLINYSALARLISEELKIEKKTSNEAILVAARRYQFRLSGENSTEYQIKKLLADSEISIKNKIIVVILKKTSPIAKLHLMQASIHEHAETCYLLEGSDNFTLITQERFLKDIEKELKNAIIKTSKNLALITLMTPKEIETISGVIGFLTTLFSEHGVNIVEFLSCWTDTLFVIETKDVPKTMEFLKF